MRFLSDILAKAGLIVDGAVVFNSTANGQTPASNDDSTKLATTAWVRSFTQPYTLPIASATILGGVKVGTGLAIDPVSGVLSLSGGGVSIKSTETFTATQGQSIFTITNGYTVGLIDVFLNGVYLSPGQITATNGITITLNDPAIVGDIIDVIVTSPLSEGSLATTDQLPEGTTNLYYTDSRARAAISLTTTGVSGAATYNILTGQLNIPNYQGLVPAGGIAGQILAKNSATSYDTTWIDNYTSQVQHIVKAGVAVTKGQAVYVSSADGTNMIVSKASNASEGTSSKTLGLIAQDLALNGQGFVVTEGLLTGLDTTGANAAGDPVWLGTDGNLIYGLVNKPVAPAHLVFIGVVTRRNANNGEIFVKVQNGFELDELHNLSVKNASDGDMIKYVASTGLWTKIAATTTNISEGTNLYYTDVRVGSYLTANSYATQSYVATQIANLVASAPATLDTLNELATALGNDPNFATTVTTSIGTKVPQARTITINGTAYDLSADRSWTIAAGLTSFNSRTGAITLTSGDVTTALGFTPYNTTNPSGYITGITSGNVITALGYTPVTNARTITINGTAYDLSADRAWTISGSDSTKLPLAGGTLSGALTISTTGVANSPSVRINTSSSASFVHTQENFAANITAGQRAMIFFGKEGSTKNAGGIGYYWAGAASNSNFISLGHWGNDDLLRVYGDGVVTVGTNNVLHAGNYNSYAVPLSGGSMSGGLIINSTSNGVGSGFQLYTTTYQQYLQIYSNGDLEAMVNYRNSNAQWYVGLRTTAQLVGNTGFHFYNTSSGQSVGGYTLAGAHYSIGSAYANGNRLVENTGTWGINITGTAGGAFGMSYDGNAISGMGPISNWDSRPGVGQAGFGINWHTGVSISGYAGYGGVRLYASGYPTHAGSVLRLEASGAVYTYGGLYSDGNLVLHAGNYTSYTDGRYWLNNGSWLADLGSSGFTRIFGNETSGGGFAILTNPNGGGQTSILIDGSYISGENNGFYSLGAANQYSSRRGWYNDGSTINFRTNNSVISTANIRVYPVSESWAEGLSFIMPTSQVWGGLRWQRERSGSDGNWYVGFTALDSSDDLVFGANNGGTQNDSIIRLTKAGLVSMQKAPGGANLMLGAIDYSRVYNDSDRSSLVINSPYYPHLYLNAMNNSGNGTHGPVISMSGILTAGGYRRWAMGIANTNPSHFSIGWADNNTNPHYGVGHDWSQGGRFVLDTSGNLIVTGDVTAYGAQSDARLKTIKEKVPNALEGILKLNGYRFDWKEREVKITTFVEDIGVVAQEVALVFPELARTGEDGWMSVRYQGLTAVLIEGIKEQQIQIEAQQSEIIELKDLVKQLLAK